MSLPSPLSLDKLLPDWESGYLKHIHTHTDTHTHRERERERERERGEGEDGSGSTYRVTRNNGCCYVAG